MAKFPGSVFINDGYTLKGRYPGNEGVCPPVSFSYRLCLPEEGLTFQNALSPSHQVAELAAICDRCCIDFKVELDNVKPEAWPNVLPSKEEWRKVFLGCSMYILNSIRGVIGPDLESMAKN